MSAPTPFERSADHIKYGLLATRSRTIIDNILNERGVTDDDEQILTRAAEFVRLLLEGTSFATTGTYTGRNSRESLNVLAYALNPLHQIQTAVQAGEIADLLSRVHQALIDAAVNRDSLAEESLDLLRTASNFFDLLHTSLSGTLVEHRRTTAPLPVRRG